MGENVESFKEIKEAILSEVPGSSERAIIDQVELSQQDGHIIVYCPSLFLQQYISRQYRDLIVKCIHGALERPVDVEFWVDARKKSRNNQLPQPKPVQMMVPSTQPYTTSCGLNAKFTFNEFVVGRCNAFAYEAAWAVSEDDISKYNPIYFYSDIGLGKSHISHAIGNRSINTKPKIRIRYTTASEFSQGYVYSVRNNQLDKFKNNYISSNLDVFFIDDVHLLKNKEKTQFELSYILDDLISAGKQVILSGFRPPSSMPYIEKGLKSRCSAGLVINIKRPEMKTRCQIVKRKAQSCGVELPDDVVEFISENIRSNIRELESAVLTISAMSSLLKKNLNLSLAKEMLEGTLEKQKQITIEYIQDFVTKNFGLTKEILISPSRKQGIVYPRQIAIFLCRRYTKEPLQNIGQAFSRKHSSIIHSLEVIDTKYHQNLKTKREIDFLIEKLDSQFS